MTTAATPTSRVHLRVRPWRGDPATAECLAIPIGSIVSPNMVSDALERARAHGFERAVTPAMPPYEWRPYLDAGFTIREHLHLLGHDLNEITEQPDGDLRRARRRDTEAIIAVDHAAFGPFWRMDDPSLREAARATAVARLRVAVVDDAVVGYSLYGRSGDRGYLQRLAVHPAKMGAGLGSALVIEGLRWLKRRRVREVLVNTQESNERALDLYRRLGFALRPGGLAVLESDLSAL